MDPPKRDRRLSGPSSREASASPRRERTDAPPPPSRVAERLAARAASGATGFIPYLTAGYPDMATTVRVARALAALGADVLELGVPFSDPVADGPVIQRASHAALARGATLGAVLEAVAEVRASVDTPIVLMTYVNPVLAFGAERFATRARAAGADGVLLTDLPPDEEPAIWAACADAGLSRVLLVAPTTRPARRRELAAGATAFVYVLSRLGVTGADAAFGSDLEEIVADVRAVAQVPVAIGFGIARPEQAASLRRLADALVIGSALVRAVEDAAADPVAAVESWTRALLPALGRPAPPPRGTT